MSETRTSNEKIGEALELLNQAAIEKKAELQTLMADKFAHIKAAMSSGAAQGEVILQQAQAMAKKGGEKACEIAGDVDKSVHKDPWPYIAGAATLALVVGYLMGSSRK